ncbi:MAG: penicillin-binding protein 2 [Ignavibacteriaceae bacterium]|nr:penicillin-binding protein 2 [Ignavibacterium sp.]MCC6255978.1 penicillin-binding protein 2 [Ignavibacteriaceae bacterium]HRN25749.1 penicillin-binding protein 2 [Ignavibacteriaceae bacterium]HRQ53974.1 penicillin-binding protein 2 [Ignavibacteriaceae bacterium]
MRSDNFASISRRTFIYTFVVILFGVLSFRLFQMQILNQEVYEEKSADNSIKAIEQTPFRGVFYDRNLKVMVDNIPAYTLRITPADYDSKLNPFIDKIIGADSGFVASILKKNKIYSKYVPIRIKRGIDFEVVSWLEENQENLPGVDFIVEMQRGYPIGIKGSHSFGYTKEISPAQLEKEKDYYVPGDYVGHNGIEKQYEKDLRGIKGFNYVLVNSKRKEIGKYKDGVADKNSIKGKNLVLSYDADVQKVAEEQMLGKRGAIVAIEPKTGEILALVSAPDYDLNQFSYVTSREFLSDLYNNPDKPSFNRATMSLKPPGSTFKMLAAIAALDMGVITESTTINCGGGFTFGRFFKCHGNHGSINVVHAIEKSCNSFFYNLIYKIGLDKWKEYAEKFGFNSKTGIDIGEESAGFIPGSDYYVKIYGEKWPRSIMASLGIGQGEVSVTPLQLANYVSLIANDGSTYQPHIVKGYLDDKTKQIIPYKFPEVKTGIRQDVFDIVKEGMFLVVNGSGTATHIRMSDIKISGKTGTAQNPHGKDHALFVGYAPSDNPKIAFAIVIENVGFGGTHAAPIAKALVEAYLKKETLKKNEIKKDNHQTIVGVKLED